MLDRGFWVFISTDAHVLVKQKMPCDPDLNHLQLYRSRD